MTSWSCLGFQDASSFIIEQVIFFNDHAMLVLLVVSLTVFYYIASILRTSFFDRNSLECHEVEFVWTILPSFLLVFIAFPSLKLLYLIDEIPSSSLTYKGVGYQWYWVYELAWGEGRIEWGSYANLFGNFRLIDADDCLYIPFDLPIRFLTTSGDVIHSWTVPSLGLKADSVPGRLNQLFFHFSRIGLFVGQCSEICGPGHRFIPIVVEVVPVSFFY